MDIPSNKVLGYKKAAKYLGYKSMGALVEEACDTFVTERVTDMQLRLKEEIEEEEKRLAIKKQELKILDRSTSTGNIK